MLYAIISEDVKNSLERRLAARPDHLARLEKLRDEGRLVRPLSGGPKPPAMPASAVAWWSPSSTAWKPPRPGPTPTRTLSPGSTPR